MTFNDNMVSIIYVLSYVYIYVYTYFKQSLVPVVICFDLFVCFVLFVFLGKGVCYISNYEKVKDYYDKHSNIQIEVTIYPVS